MRPAYTGSTSGSPRHVERNYVFASNGISPTPSTVRVGRLLPTQEWKVIGNVFSGEKWRFVLRTRPGTVFKALFARYIP
jgi:hypothetical protein